jgi:hypothetical protein
MYLLQSTTHKRMRLAAAQKEAANLKHVDRLSRTKALSRASLFAQYLM